ncbi:MAG: serine/threonine protein kinase, partial [Myxococcales bacterium]|nr:serine/threonine protein kinase [Myxococcales bacterium]
MLPMDLRLVSLRDALPGQVLLGTRGARYHLRERVGEGGQGWVFRANWDEPGGYAVVVKVLRPDAVTAESLARFEREAHVLRMLGQDARPNPHVVRFFDHATARLVVPAGGDPVDLPFTVLEYVRGHTLEHVLQRSRGAGLALDRTRRIARQIVLALEDVHAQKVVHRDLKPSNVLLATEGDNEIAKVTDFGLVKLVDIGLGRTTALAGASLGYAPPEQFEQGNRRVGVRTDVFSFAAILYEMLTGAKAFPYGDGENPLVVVTRLLNGPRPRCASTRGALPHELAMRPDLVERLDAILTRATAAEPGERPTSIEELWAAIEPILRAASERRSIPGGAPLGGAGDAATAVDLRTPPPPAPPRPPVGPTVDGPVAAPPNAAPSPDVERALARPAAWTWRIRVASIRPALVRAAAFDPSGESAVAIGPAGHLAWHSSSAAGWMTPASALGVEAPRVRGLAWLRVGGLVAFGARGLVAQFSPGTGTEAWTVPDPEITFLGAHVDAQGTTVTLVGERPARG